MDANEYIKVLKKEKKFFWLVVGILWLITAFWQALQPPQYQGSLLLNIGRTGGNETTEYTFDSFYRLQADERFADTLVRWLASPRVVSDILDSAGVSSDEYSRKELEGFFLAKRLSSQVVEVEFYASNRDLIARYGEGIKKITNEYTNTVGSADDSSWFRVTGADPIIRDARVTPWPFLGITFAASLFVAFWVTLLRHFLRAENKINQGGKKASA